MILRPITLGLGAGLLLAAMMWPAPEKALNYYQERFRPQFHFSPERNFINDPNGLVYHAGEHHLFYQYNPFGDTWGHMSWGHAVSRDMVRWQHLPVALYEENGVMIFSGSAVVDHQNSSGFGTSENLPLVAFYTGAEKDRQSQHIAFSTDRGRTWTKYSGNPVIDLNERDFRDPKVFWYEPDKRWIMVVSLAEQRRVLFYASSNLKEWSRVGEFGPAGAPDAPNWECPDLYEIPVANLPGVRKWVLEIGIGNHAPGGGSGGMYFVGDFDGRKFVNDNPADQTLWVDYGADFYAAQTWSDIPPADGRRIMLGWMNNWRYANKVPTSPWRGQMSLPRAVTLQKFAEGVRMMQAPAAELKKLRGKHVRLSERNVSGDGATIGLRGETLEIIAEFEPGNAKEFGLRVRKGSGEETLVGYDPTAKEIFLDRTRSGEAAFHLEFPARHRAPLEPENGVVRLHIFVDRSSVEVFANHGRRVITDLIFPGAASDGVEIYARGGTARLRSLDAWRLNSAWK